MWVPPPRLAKDHTLAFFLTLFLKAFVFLGLDNVHTLADFFLEKLSLNQASDGQLNHCSCLKDEMTDDNNSNV